jgi:hypothetical protein
MLADMVIKPAAGNGQWRNTDLPPILTENGLWHRQFIPTVLLWAGSQSSFWTIKAADLLCAVQAIFNMMYPKVKYNIQPRGPIMGMVSVICIHTFIHSFNHQFKDHSALMYLAQQLWFHCYCTDH